MSEIKLDPAFDRELSTVKKSGNGIKSREIIMPLNLNTLPAATAFGDAFANLTKTMLLYRQLVDKDVSELQEFTRKMLLLDRF